MRYLGDIEEGVATLVDVDVMSWIGSHQDEHPKKALSSSFMTSYHFLFIFFTNTMRDQNSLL